jgi:HPt (histidine-containing phosphotransfer) domain-containing protein
MAKPSPILIDEAEEAPIFDYRGTLHRLGGSRELFFDLAHFFVEDSDKLLERLHSALERRDHHGIESAIHSLKGLIANFGAPRATFIAIEAEQCAHSGKLDDVVQIYPRLVDAVHTLRNALSLATDAPSSAHLDRPSPQ